MDDSQDEVGGAFSALIVPEDTWQKCFDGFREFRRRLKASDGIYVYKEFHAWKFVSGRGQIADRVVSKGRRAEIFRETLGHVAKMPGVRSMNAFFPHKQDEKAFEFLLNRINTTMVKSDSRALIISDKGKEAKYTRLARKMHVYNPIPSNQGAWADTGRSTKNIPIDRIIEDPFFKDSEQSYFIQIADFCAYALLRQERPTERIRRYGLDSAFEQMRPVVVTQAHRADPKGMGIIRIHPK